MNSDKSAIELLYDKVKKTEAAFRKTLLDAEKELNSASYLPEFIRAGHNLDVLAKKMEVAHPELDGKVASWESLAKAKKVKVS